MTRSTKAVVGVGIVAALTGVLLLAVIESRRSQRPKPTVVSESRTDRDQSIREVYGSASATANASEERSDQALARAADQFFADLGQAFRAKDQSRLESLVSAEAMFDFADRSGLVPQSFLEKRQIKAAFAQGLVKGLLVFAEHMAFDSHEIRRIDPISDREMVVFVRLWMDELETYSKMRWWLLLDRHERWVAYDYEDFDANLRTSSFLGVLLSAGSEAAPWIRPFQDMINKLKGSSPLDIPLSTIEGDIDRLLAQNLPLALELYVRNLKCGAHVANEEFADCLEEVERLAKLDPDLPMLHYYRGTCHWGLQHWREAIDSFTAYGDLLGWDSDVHELVADAYYGQGDLVKSAEHASLGLADNANAWGCLMSYCVAVPKEKWADLKPLVMRTSEPESAFETVIDYAVQEEKLELARALLAYLKEEFPESELIEYYENSL